MQAWQAIKERSCEPGRRHDTGRRAATLGLALACLAVTTSSCWGGAAAPTEAAAPASGSGATAAGTRSAPVAGTPAQDAPAAPAAASVVLTDQQLSAIRVGVVAQYAFPQQRVAVGSIGFNEDLAIQVYPPYPGRIIQAKAQLGDVVDKGALLYTIDSPDLVQAEAALIAAAGTYELTSAALTRARGLFQSAGGTEKDMQQAIADQQSAEGALKAARDALRVFGKSAAQIDRIVAERSIDPALVVASPIRGRVVARNAQPGLLVQPGVAPAPYAVADLSTLWMLAAVPESDSPLLRLGQQVQVKVMAYGDRDFTGSIAAIGATVDPATHTVLVRAAIRDPQHELRPGMFASYVISIGAAVLAPALPQAGIVREGDGSMTAWVTTDGHHFKRRSVKLGLQHGDLDQILEGLQPGEQAVTDGAVFLSNMLNASADS